MILGDYTAYAAQYDELDMYLTLFVRYTIQLNQETSLEPLLYENQKLLAAKTPTLVYCGTFYFTPDFRNMPANGSTGSYREWNKQIHPTLYNKIADILDETPEFLIQRTQAMSYIYAATEFASGQNDLYELLPNPMHKVVRAWLNAPPGKNSIYVKTDTAHTIDELTAFKLSHQENYNTLAAIWVTQLLSR